LTHYHDFWAVETARCAVHGAATLARCDTS
jgi:hypothetical protein